jgi:hypothetical protein
MPAGRCPERFATATSAPATSKPATNPVAAAKASAETERKIAALGADVHKAFAAGDYDKALTLSKKIIALDPHFNLAWYNLACVYGRQKKADQAVESLNSAIENGFADLCFMEHDPDLDAIRDSAGYQKILARREEIQYTRAEGIRDGLVKEMGPKFICEIDEARKLVIATDVDRATLDAFKAHLTQVAEAEWKDLFSFHFEQYITVVIPRDFKQSRVGGYYDHENRSLVASTIGAPLTHEFTHALEGADMDGRGQVHPIWIMEGLATLFESSRLEDGHIVPQPNQRLYTLKAAVPGKRYIPFDKFLKLDQGAYMKQAMMAYPEGRYIMMYLYEMGLLRKWYEAYTAGFATDPTGAAALEKVCGKKLAAIEADWARWIGTLKAPAASLPANHAYIGVHVENQADGLRITSVVSGSGADKAGLKIGDVLMELDGQCITESTELMQFVDGMNVGDRLTVNFRRDKACQDATVVLGPMPAEVANPNPAGRRRGGTPPPARAPAATPTGLGASPATTPTSLPTTLPALPPIPSRQAA